MNSVGETERAGSPAVAIVGMAGRFPRAAGVEEFWRNLLDGVEAVTFFSDEELRAAGADDATLNNPEYIKARAVLPDIDLFAADFFGFNPREAEIMDPQQRIFLECAWEALENAGYNSDLYAGRIGVYAGVDFNTYLLNNLITNVDALRSSIGLHQSKFSNDKDFVATRACYKLNLRGPGVTVQTGSSTSLVAVHLGCQSLLVGESDMVLAGGVTVVTPQNMGYFHLEGGISSDDGHCRAFDVKGRGTVGGSGVGIVVLKRLEDALADGDYVHAVIRGSAINNDGAAKVGFTAPSPEGQSQVIRETLALAGVEPEEIGYVEAHGSGTELGDVVEVAALQRAFGPCHGKKQFCAIGSVKTNVGHLNCAAGVASLIKTVLSVKHGVVPASLNCDEPNPKIDFANSPFYVNTRLAPWPLPGRPRRAGVSNWGIGGTNAHVILEEAEERTAVESSRPWHLIPLSAKTETALESATKNLVAHMKRHPEESLADIAYTLQVGRKPFKHRRVVVCRDREDAIQTLETGDPRRVYTGAHEPAERPVIFMFPGLGDQYVRMASELYRVEPTFRRHVDACCELLAPHLGVDLREVLFPAAADGAGGNGRGSSEPGGVGASLDLRRMLRRDAADEVDEHTKRLNQTSMTQPAMFVIEYATARLWMERGVRPQALIGYSIGEYVAACLAGVFTLKDALAFVALRAKMIEALPEGAMLAVPLSEQEARQVSGGAVSLAAVNGPALCVLAGTVDAVQTLQSQLSDKGVASRRLQTAYAFHSKMMEPLTRTAAALAATVDLKPPRIPYVSNVTGRWITDAEATSPDYWARHMCEPVRFADGVGELLKEPNAIFLEVGPGLGLASFVRQHPEWDETTGHIALPSLPHAHDRQSDSALMLNTLGRLWLAGAQVDWTKLYAGERRGRLPLPTYPFERRRYWIEPVPAAGAGKAAPASLTKRSDISEWFYTPVWKEASLYPRKRDAAAAHDSGPHVVFTSDDDELGSQILRRLEQRGAEVVVVRAGEGFGKQSDDAYHVNPAAEEDYDALFGELRADGKVPRAILHLWGHTAAAIEPDGARPQDEAPLSDFFSVLFLARALGRAKLSEEPIQLLVVSGDQHRIMGEEVVSPSKAAVIGVCKVIQQEHPNVSCRNVDITTQRTGGRLVERLLTELDGRDAEPVVAYRGDRRWIQTFEPLRFDAAEGTPERLRREGVYLFTGGLGELNLALAKYLAEAVQARLIFVERGELPPWDTWRQYAAGAAEDDALAVKLRLLQEFESAGAETMIINADAGDRAQMRDALNSIRERFGALHGVIHTPERDGAHGFGAIQEVEPRVCERFLASGAQSLSVLEEALQGQELDFCILQSSISSVLGGVGGVNYSSSNLLTEAFAQRHNRADGLQWSSIAWDRLRFTGSGLGLGGGGALDEFVITPQEAQQVFARLLSLDAAPHVVVSTGDLAARIDKWLRPSPATAGPDANGASGLMRHTRPVCAMPYVAPESEVEKRVAELWKSTLGIEQVGIHDSFFELGGHSLLGTQLVTRLREMFEVDLRLQHLFTAPTVEGLATIIEALIIEEVDALTEEEAATLL